MNAIFFGTDLFSAIFLKRLIALSTPLSIKRAIVPPRLRTNSMLEQLHQTLETDAIPILEFNSGSKPERIESWNKVEEIINPI